MVWEIVTDFERDSSFEPPVLESEPLPVTDEEISFVADPNDNVLESDAVAEGSSCDRDCVVDADEDSDTDGVRVQVGDCDMDSVLEPYSCDCEGVMENVPLTDFV